MYCLWPLPHLLFVCTTLVLFVCTTLVLFMCTTLVLFMCTTLVLFMCTTLVLFMCPTVVLVCIVFYSYTNGHTWELQGTWESQKEVIYNFFLLLSYTSCANRAQLATVWSTGDTCTVCGHPTMSNYSLPCTPIKY